VGTLFDLSQRFTKEMEARYPDPMELLRAKGEAAQKAGFMISLVSATDADDPDRIARLRDAARELGIDL